MTFLAYGKFDVKNLVVIGTDNAYVMVWIDNGAYTKLKKNASSLILLRCVCHYLPFAISHTASECLPRTFIIAESHK